MAGYVYQCPECGYKNHYSNRHMENNDVNCTECHEPIEKRHRLPNDPGTNSSKWD